MQVFFFASLSILWKANCSVVTLPQQETLMILCWDQAL